MNDQRREIGPGVYAVGTLGEIEMDQEVIEDRQQRGLSVPQAITQVGPRVSIHTQPLTYWLIDFGLDRQCRATERIQAGQKPTLDDEPTGQELGPWRVANAAHAAKLIRKRLGSVQCRFIYQGKLLHV